MKIRWNFVLLVLLVLLHAGLVWAVPSRPRWPTLAEQFRQDKVKPGSALEKLIRDNQDFSILPTDCGDEEEREAPPPWLRVLFHKNHREVAHLGKCPEGGYPEFLELIHAWMVSHQDLVPGKALSAKAPTSGKASVGGDRRISGAVSSPRSESDIRINPWNASRIVAASNDLFSGASLQAQFYSLDGGATWGQSSLPLLSGDSFQGDPAVDWTSNGTAWSSTLGIAAGATSSRLQIYKSNNGGASWTWDSTVPGTETGLTDKDMFWVDHSNTSPFKDNLYVIWSGFTTSGVHVYVSRKNGPAGTWSPSLEVSTDFFIGGTNGTDIKTNAYGDVFAFYPRFSDHKILLAKSTDGGLTFAAPAVVANTYAAQFLAVPAQAGSTYPSHYGTITYISAGAFRTSTKNLVCIVWRDLSGETGCTTSANAPGTNTGSSCKARIWFTRSTDGGATWEAPRMLYNQATLNDQFNPHLAVDDTNGTIGVIYYDTVSDTGRKKTDVWYQSSFDDGVTWSQPVKITTAQSDETQGTSNSFQYGDYNGLSGYNGTFLPSWTDSRSGREEIWTATLLDSPPVTPKDARVLSQSVPTAMVAGQSYPISVTLKNAGSLTWSPVGPQCNAYRWGSLNGNWTPSRADLSAAVTPGQEVTLNFTVTAPAVSGLYDFQWRMVHECVEWFGDTSPNVAVPVTIFADVPLNYWARRHIEAIYNQGITAGCALNPRRYCPEDSVSRAQIAVFLIAAKGPAGYVPPACTTPIFNDVPCTHWAAPWVNEFARRGITSGCGGGNYCPDVLVDRGTMAYFLLATLGIPAPTSCTGMFSDVPCTAWYAPWVEELARRGITAGCGGGQYCPTATLSRAGMAVFLVGTFGIPLP